MSGTVITGRTAVAPDGTIYEYVPPNMAVVPVGNTVSYSSYVQIQAGNDWPPVPGTYQVGNGSGASTVATAVTYRTVTITPLPT